MPERRRLLAFNLVHSLVHGLVHSLVPIFVGLSLLTGAAAVRADDAPFVRVSALSDHLQSVVTVQGRTGHIAEKFETKGIHVFTLRDDYDNQVFVRTPSKDYPIMGSTYRITGYPMRDHGTLFLNTLPGQMVSVYPLNTVPTLLPAPVPAAATPSPSLLWLPAIATLVAGAIILAIALRRWLGRPQPEWGELFVTSGPDRGMTVSLRRPRYSLGRGVSAVRDVRFSGGDQTISNTHALITHRRGELYVCDMSSNGTRVGGEKLEVGKPRKINSGDLIHLGTRGTVVIVRLRSLAPAPGLLSLLREPSVVGDKTIMVPETAPEEPAWMRNGAEAPPAAAVQPDPVAVEAPAIGTPETVAVGVAESDADEEAHSHLEIVHQPVAEREVEADEDEDEEDSIPHTHLSPMIFSFAGHSPRGSRARSDEGTELVPDADEEPASA